MSKLEINSKFKVPKFNTCCSPVVSHLERSEKSQPLVTVLTSRSTGAAGRVNRPNAFTLIELLLVLAILGVLAAIVVPRFVGRSEQARVIAAQTEIDQIAVALESFEIDNGRFPTTDQGLGALASAPADVSNWNGPYLRGASPKDPWGKPFVYIYPGRRNPDYYDLYSAGADGQEGSDDDVHNFEQS